MLQLNPFPNLEAWLFHSSLNNPQGRFTPETGKTNTQNRPKQTQILIVDDELLTLRTMSALLKEEGYIVHTASDANEAIAKVQEVFVDIIFMDIKLPGINGIEAFKKIKQIAPQIPVVLMTAYSMDELIREGYSEGALSCIYKPFQIKDVIDLVERLHN